MTDIWYAEVPFFYAEIERVRDSRLRERPVIVGGDPRKKGKVQSASAEAEKAGVAIGMEVSRGLELCPQARAVRTDMAHYREVSGSLRACFREAAEAIEPVGLDSAFIQPREEAVRDVEVLGQRVRERLGLPLRVGVAQVKFLSRLAAEGLGREGVFCIRAGGESEFLRPLPVSRLPGVGPRTVATLRELGVERVGDLLAFDESEMESRLGNHGLRILEFARGEDHSGVQARQIRQSLSRVITFEQPESDRGEINGQVERMSREIVSRLDREGWIGHRVSLKVSFEGGLTNTRSRSLGRPVEGIEDLCRVALGLVDLTQVGSRPARRLGLSVAQLEPAASRGRQLELFGPAQK